MSLEVQSICVGYYKEVDILSNFSLHAKRSKITGVIGPNGSGKSTLIKTVYGFLKPRKGKIYYGDAEITGMPPHSILSMGVSYIPQTGGLFPNLTVRENLKLGAWTFRNDKQRVYEAIKRISEIYPVLKDKENDRAGFLSGGQQKMLVIGRALITDPEAILFDEPTAGLAPKVAHEVYSFLEVLKKRGLTLLVVDQNVRAVITFSDYIYEIEYGRNKSEGPKEKFESNMEKIVKSWI